ncbi:DNA replication/repair protein RecF [Fibrobacter sp.]|uniref:DNA replication/repair protein RecF n=1 Tax=Fibrobacter sp. TaxID=35828 RepID=UPI002606F605|nr:DNA replication and repair protein RecF [Fibrobacter sp.]MDD7498814.1 DNA replication and repair protein RecF [Fibrobacter sp.]MDY5723526.1 DNA replication and repair protein RecF [Fibrobacter sp.]
MISKIYIEGVRSLFGFEQEFGPGITVVHGPNGCGKTSILESVHLLAQGFSFRARDLKELIAWNGDEFLLRATFEDSGRTTARAICVGRRSCDVRENGENLKSAAALFGSLPAVVMQPSDIELLRGAPDVRRRWLNEILCFRSKANASLLRRYGRVLQQRNKWLRDFKRGGGMVPLGGEELFGILTEQLIDLGAKLWAARLSLSKEISPIITGYYRKLSGGVDEITCAYKSSILKELDALDGAEFLDDAELDKVAAEPSVPYNVSGDDSGMSDDGSVDEESLRTAFSRKLRSLEIAERSFGGTLAGPHRDDLGICIGGSEMRSSGSQGQCRCAAIAMRFAAVDVASRFLSKPILLLDDIFAELDVKRRDAVAALIREKACQVIIATPQLEEMPFTAEASIELRA